MSISYRPEFEPEFGPQNLLEKVQTIGYRQPNGLVEIDRIMTSDPSMILLDIRHSPKSKNLQWTKTAFSKKYQKRYLWLKALGNVNHHEKGNIQIADPEAGIQQLVLLLQDHSILLLCGCENYEECHRKVVYDLLEAHMHNAYENIPRNNLTGQVTELPKNINIHVNNSSVQVSESAKDAKDLEATCFLPSSEIYVDDIWDYPDTDLPSKKWCHLATNGNIDDLHAFAEKLQLKRSWFQDKPNHPHYDLTPGKRAQAIKHGAVAVNHIELVRTCFPKLVEITNNVPQNIIDMFTQEEATAIEPAPEILKRIVIEQEEQLSIISAENTRYREREAKALRIIEKLLKLRHHNTNTVPLKVFNQEKERRQQAEQRAAKEAQRVKQFRQSPFKPTERLIIDELQYQLENPNARRDPDGYTAICLETVGKHINMSASTAGRGIEAVQKQWTAAPVQYKKVPEHAADGRQIDRLYIKSEASNLVPLALNANITETKIQQGGDRYTCQKCGSIHISRHIIKKVLLVCDDCGHSIPETEETVSIDYPNASYTKQDAAKKKANACNLQPNIITSDPPSVCAVENNQDNISAAAKLLLAIAGTHDQHIEMSRNGEKKYYSVDRPLSLADLEDHLKGGKARGSLCSHPEGKTRALCFDADDIEGWTILQDAAKRLAEVGYIPLLEESPADRGGHLWLISDNMINGDAARERAYQIAPDLKQIIEYWPAPLGAKNWNRVRLPGAYYCRIGKYVEHDVKGWCKIVNVASVESSHDGESAAALLLGSLTLVEVMAPKNLPPDDHNYKQEPEARTPVTPAIEQPLSAIEQELGYKLPIVDEKWEAKNGKITETTLYFAVMPNYAAECYNREHRLEEIHPLETNGMALSPNGSERTASTNYHETENGERYTDHSQHGRRTDGTRDTGDALELAAKVQGTPKPELLRMSTGQIVKKARADLEAAARNGQDIPHWLEYPVCIITPAGRRHYTFELGKSQNGQRGRNPDQLGAGSNNLSEGSRGSIRVSTSIRAENREAGNRILEPIREVSRKSIVEIGDRSTERNDQGAERGDRSTQENASNTAEVIEAERKVTEQISDYPHLKEGMQVLTPAGIATISSISQCPILKKHRCSVHSSTAQPNGSHFAAFHLSEVTPFSQQTLL